MEAIGNGAALLVQQEINNAVSQGTGTAADVKDITEHPEPEQEEENKEEETKAEDEDREEEKRVEEEKEIELEQELGPETEPLVEEEEAEPGRFTSHDSPDRYFSPRRDEEVPEGIVSEGLSSEYNLPRYEHVKEGEYDKVVVEEKNPTGLEKEEELRKKENDSAPDEVPVSKISNVRPVSLPIGGRSFPSLEARRFQVSCAAKKETVDKVCQIVRKQLALPDDASVTGESKFANLGADSLDTVEIVMGLEEEFGISVEEESAQSITTVQEAADMIEKLTEKN